MIQRIIGIDFGTSTSLIRVKRYQDDQPFGGDQLSTECVKFGGHDTVPTLVRISDDATQTRFGEEAEYDEDGTTLYANFKVELESKDAETAERARRLTEAFFANMYKEYSAQLRHLGDDGDQETTIVGHPAKWTPETVRRLVRAAEKAGFRNVRPMSEPEAAIRAVRMQEGDALAKALRDKADKPAYVMVADMGAGTTDIAIYRAVRDENENFATELVCTWPGQGVEIFFGGREMDELFCGYVLAYLNQNIRAGRLAEGMTENFLREYVNEAKAWKERTVSPSLKSGKTVSVCSFIKPFSRGLEPFPAFDAEKFENEIAASYLSAFPELLQGALDAAKAANGAFSKDDIALAILTGGHSQWYFVEKLIRRALGDHCAIKQLARPQETVGFGLVSNLRSVRQANPQPPADNARAGEETHPRPTAEKKPPVIKPCIAIRENFVTSACHGLYALRKDGVVLSTEPLPDAVKTAAIAQIVSSIDRVFYLKADGGVILGDGVDVTGRSYQPDPAEWNDIVQLNVVSDRDLSAYPFSEVIIAYGLKRDGTVVCQAYYENTKDTMKYIRTLSPMLEYVSALKEIKRLGTGSGFSLWGGEMKGQAFAAVKNDGTVAYYGDDPDVARQVGAFEDVADVVYGHGFVKALKNDSCVVATSPIDEVYTRNIRAMDGGLTLSNTGCILCDSNFDPTLAGRTEYISVINQAKQWNDLIAVASSMSMIAGIRENGRVVCTRCVVIDIKNDTWLNRLWHGEHCVHHYTKEIPDISGWRLF